MAKGFKFKLQSVLDIKIKEEDDEKRKFADVMQLQAREEQVLANMHRKRTGLIVELKTKQGAGGINIGELQMYSSAIERLKHEIISQELRLKEIALMLEEQRKRLIEATQQKKIYEKLKENQEKAFKEEEDYKEKLLIDELATLKYAKIKKPEDK